MGEAGCPLGRWALPFLTDRAPSERYAALYTPAPPRQPHQNGRPRKKGARLPTLARRAADPATDWAPLAVTQWYGQRERTVEIVSGTAVWYHTGLPAVTVRWVLVRDPHERFATQALLCTDLAIAPQQSRARFVRRLQMEAGAPWAAFEEARRHLGVETQRQWTEGAIHRTTPTLLGLFSLVTLLAHPRLREQSGPIRQAAWYDKRMPAFADALAVGRREIWAHTRLFACRLTTRRW